MNTRGLNLFAIALVFLIVNESFSQSQSTGGSTQNYLVVYKTSQIPPRQAKFASLGELLTTYDQIGWCCTEDKRQHNMPQTFPVGPRKFKTYSLNPQWRESLWVVSAF